MRTCAICHAPEEQSGQTCAFCGEASWHPSTVEGDPAHEDPVSSDPTPAVDEVPIVDAFPSEPGTATETPVAKSKRQMKREAREAAKATGTLAPDAPSSDADLDEEAPETLDAPPVVPAAHVEGTP